MRITKLPERISPEVDKTCFKCKCEFAYLKEDVKFDYRDGNYVECPCCSVFIAVS